MRETKVNSERGTEPARLWWLPVVAGLLPAAATFLAFQLAVGAGQFSSCNPYLDGCVSISRAARHDLPNHVFRALMLPAATLQAIVWLLTAPWLRRLGAANDRLLRMLPLVGFIAAVFLVLYGAFLGTDGASYRWLRRYGVVVYFGFTCISMLIVAGATQRVAVDGRLRRVGIAMFALCAALPLLGVANATAPLYAADAAASDAVENITEWWGATVFTIYFLLLGWLWRATRYGAALVTAEH